MAAGTVLGSFADRPLPNLRTSGLGVAPKKNGKWRVILHLSAPHGSSVNDGILKEKFSLHYSSVDDAVGLLQTYGTGAIMAKLILSPPSEWFLYAQQTGTYRGCFGMACTMWTHACPLGSDLHHACSTILLMPFIGSLLPTTTLMRSTNWMIFFLWGQRASNNVPPPSKSHSQFVKGWGFLLPLRNWRDHQHKSSSWDCPGFGGPPTVTSPGQAA